MLERSTVPNWLTGLVPILLLLGHTFARKNNSLLASTLFIFKDRACNNEKLRMRCPQGTAISVRWAQYGRPTSSETLCPPISSNIEGGGGGGGGGRGGSRVEYENVTHPQNQHRQVTFTPLATVECLAPSSLQVVMNLCEGHRNCHIKASPQVFGGDPCPGIDKVLKVGYQCQPKELVTQTTCRGNFLEIRCSSAQRIAIHSAFYGYSSAFNVSQCDSQPAYDAGCSSFCSMQIVGRLCHGRRKCLIEASPSTFGMPCQSGTREFLVVVYACVALRTLKEIQTDIFPYTLCQEEEKEGIPVSFTNITEGGPVVQTVDQLKTTSAFTFVLVSTVSPLPKAYSKSCTEEFLESILWTFLYVRDNLEKFFLYLTVSLCTGALLVLLVIIIRLSITIFRYRQREEQRLAELSQTHAVASKRTFERDEGEIVIERSVHPSPEPERPRRGLHKRTSSPSSPAFAHLWDSPVFVHVESPHESPVLGQQAPLSLLESPVWVRVEPTDATPPPPPSPVESPVWEVSQRTAVVPLSPSVPSSPVPQMVNGSRPLAETRSLSMSYTNPYRHDPSRSERRSHSVRPSRHRLPFD